MTKPVGVGIIGMGHMGRTHLAAYLAANEAGFPCRVAAVTDRHAGERRPGADKPSLPADARVYRDPAPLLADPAVQLVSICTHTDTHAELAIAAIAAGKHVLVEKPVALTADAVARVASAARTARTLCIPAMCMRFWPAWSWLKDRVADGSLGAVRSATFHRLGANPTWSPFFADTTRSGGALIDLHIHDADFVCHLFGPPREVSSAGTINHVTTAYRFDRGPEHVVAEGAWGHAPAFGFRMRYVVVFDDATADFDIGRDQALLLYRGDEKVTVPLPPATGYDGEVRAVLSALDQPNPRPPVTMDDALVTARTLDAERESLRARRPVAV